MNYRPKSVFSFFWSSIANLEVKGPYPDLLLTTRKEQKSFWSLLTNALLFFTGYASSTSRHVNSKLGDSCFWVLQEYLGCNLGSDQFVLHGCISIFASAYSSFIAKLRFAQVSMLKSRFVIPVLVLIILFVKLLDKIIIYYLVDNETCFLFLMGIVDICNYMSLQDLQLIVLST